MPAGGSRPATTSRLKELLLPDLASGKSFATVGISHLTTSRQHMKTPVLRAERVDGGFVFDGYSPWVTGAPHAQHVVTGAVMMENGEPTSRASAGRVAHRSAGCDRAAASTVDRRIGERHRRSALRQRVLSKIAG